MTNTTRLLLSNAAKANVVGLHLWFQSDPRGETQVYFDLAVDLTPEKLDSRYRQALKDINEEVLFALFSNELDSKDTPSNDRSKGYFTVSVFNQLSENAANKITLSLKLLRDDTLNRQQPVFVSGAQITGKTVEKEVMRECELITKFTDGTYRAMGGSNDGQIELETNHNMADLESMLREFDSL